MHLRMVLETPQALCQNVGSSASCWLPRSPHLRAWCCCRPRKVASVAEWAAALYSPRARFAWGPAEQSFEALKVALTLAPVLRVWNSVRPTRLLTDASDMALLAILEQPNDDCACTQTMPVYSGCSNSAHQSSPGAGHTNPADFLLASASPTARVQLPAQATRTPTPRSNSPPSPLRPRRCRRPR